MACLKAKYLGLQRLFRLRSWVYCYGFKLGLVCMLLGGVDHLPLDQMIVYLAKDASKARDAVKNSGAMLTSALQQPHFPVDCMIFLLMMVLPNQWLRHMANVMVVKDVSKPSPAISFQAFLKGASLALHSLNSKP